MDRPQVGATADQCVRVGDVLPHVPQTTPDGKFTVEFVECLASCGTAPVVLVNEDLHHKVGEAEAEAILKKGQAA